MLLFGATRRRSDDGFAHSVVWLLHRTLQATLLGALFRFCLLFPATRENFVERFLKSTAIHVDEALLLFRFGVPDDRDQAQVSRTSVSSLWWQNQDGWTDLFISIKWIMVSSCRTTWLSASWFWSPLGLRSGWSHEYNSEMSTMTSM